MYDIEFQFHKLNIWFRVNDVKAKNEEEACVIARENLKEKSGIDVEELAEKNSTTYYIEIPYEHEDE